jgi:DNA-binding transcriptional ArsR family regulator
MESVMTRAENRPLLDDPAVLDALAHPVRLDLLGYLMSDGPATASDCARAVGDTPSNSSYHLRVLARHGLVEPADSSDGRERPWQATITGFSTDPDPSEPLETSGAARVLGASIQLDYQLAREHLRVRDRLPEEWRDVDAHANYGLRVTPDELKRIVEQIDAIARPYIAATRDDAPDGAAVATLSVLAFPRQRFE